jgi:DNA repair exonuclease SbcCD ATPase subunit
MDKSEKQLELEKLETQCRKLREELSMELESRYQQELSDAKAARAELEAELKLAEQHMTKVEQIANMYGIYFTSDISRISQSYTPVRSRHWKHEDRAQLGFEWIDVDDNKIGWEHSVFC